MHKPTTDHRRRLDVIEIEGAHARGFCNVAMTNDVYALRRRRVPADLGARARRPPMSGGVLQAARAGRARASSCWCQGSTSRAWPTGCGRSPTDLWTWTRTTLRQGARPGRRAPAAARAGRRVGSARPRSEEFRREQVGLGAPQAVLDRPAGRGSDRQPGRHCWPLPVSVGGRPANGAATTPRLLRVHRRRGARWCRLPAGRCPCSTARCRKSTWPCATRRGCSTSATWGCSSSAARTCTCS